MHYLTRSITIEFTILVTRANILDTLVGLTQKKPTKVGGPTSMLQPVDTVGKYLEQQHIPEATHPRVRNSQQGHTYMVLQCKEKLQAIFASG